MKTINELRVTIKDFRAINNATIILDGITLLTGLNSTGKSTISLLTYTFFKCANDFEKLVLQKFNDNIFEIQRILSILNDTSLRNSELKNNTENMFFKIRKIISNIEESKNMYELEENIQIFKSNFSKFLDAKSNFLEDKELTYRLSKYLGQLNNAFNLEETKSKIINYQDLEDIIFNIIDTAFNKSKEDILKRPIIYFKELLEEVLDIDKFPTKFIITEYGFDLINLSDKKSNYIGTPNIVRNAIYIETPKCIDIDGERIIWDELNGLLKNKEKKISKEYSEINDIIKQVIQGEAIYDKSNYGNEFSFKRNDGKSFNLVDVASGIQAISTLQILLKNGHINKHSLICIDEPEVHIHPQWIVEYARIIVLIQKKIGARFLIASHNPDFITAIKFIAQKEKIHNKCNFYVAEESTIKYKYNFKHEGINIENIFKKINKSFTLMEKYGEDLD